MLTEKELLCKWLLHPDLVRRLLFVQDEVKFRTGRELSIISGHRSCAEQQELIRQGRTTTPCELSSHVPCPATAVDVQIGFLPTNLQKAELANVMVQKGGLRWGGGADVIRKTPTGYEFTSEWNHFDLGAAARGQ